MFKILISSVCILFVVLLMWSINSKQLDEDCSVYKHPFIARVGIMLCTAIITTGIFVLPITIVLKLFGVV